MLGDLRTAGTLSRMKRVGMWVFIAVGAIIAVWGLVSWIAPSTSCRGVEMGPGDTCSYSSLTNEDGGKVQTYEDRIAVARQQAPFAAAAGVSMMVFGVLLERQLRRDRITEEATSDRR